MAGLTLAEVDSALAYFHDHRDEVLAEIEADDKAAAEFLRTHSEARG